MRTVHYGKKKSYPFVFSENNESLEKNISNFIDLKAVRFSAVNEGVAYSLNDICFRTPRLAEKNVNKY